MNPKIGDRIKINTADEPALLGKEGFVNRIELGCLFGTWGDSIPLLPNSVSVVDSHIPFTVEETDAGYGRYDLSFDSKELAGKAYEYMLTNRSEHPIPELSRQGDKLISIVCTHDTLLALTNDMFL